MYFTPVVAFIYVLTTQVLGDYGKSDYRYIENGLTKWCVYGTQRDIETHFSESNCRGKNLPVETHIINGKEVRFWARLSSVEGGRNRYIKNCTAPPTIAGADVDCRDHNGNVFVRVHDTCRVKCSSPGEHASRETSTCQRNGQWEEVTCIPHSCPPLKQSMGSDGNTSCDIDAWLPLDTTCPFTCPPRYEPNTRVLKCDRGLWSPLQTCAYRDPAPPVKIPQPETDWKTPTICSALFLVFIIVLGIVLYKCKKKKTTATDDTSKNLKESVSLLPPYSTGPGSQGSDQSLSVVVDDGQRPGAGDGQGTEDCIAERPPTYESACRGACQVELRYCCDGDQWKSLLPYDTLYVAEGTVVIIRADCSVGHDLGPPKCGPPFGQYEVLRDRLKVTITLGDAGSFLLWTKCSGLDDLVVVVVNVHLTDVTGNVDHTNVKQPVRPEDDLGSLAYTVEEASVDAVSSPSEPLKAEMTSLPSNPCLLTSSLTDVQDEAVRDGARAVNGARPKTPLHHARSTTSLASRNSYCAQNDEESESCTLRLGDLRNTRELRQTWDKLILWLQPVDNRPISLTIGGAAMDILGFSFEKVDYLTWAKRTDLRESPALVILTYMIQEGKTAAHLVRYFADHHHHRQDVIRLLQKAHPDCHVCRRYR